MAEINNNPIQELDEILNQRLIPISEKISDLEKRNSKQEAKVSEDSISKKDMEIYGLNEQIRRERETRESLEKELKGRIEALTASEQAARQQAGDLSKQVENLSGHPEDVRKTLQEWTTCPNCKKALDGFLNDFANTYVTGMSKGQVETLAKAKGVSLEPNSIKIDKNSVIRMYEQEFGTGPGRKVKGK